MKRTTPERVKRGNVQISVKMLTRLILGTLNDLSFCEVSDSYTHNQSRAVSAAQKIIGEFIQAEAARKKKP